MFIRTKLTMLLALGAIAMICRAGIPAAPPKPAGVPPDGTPCNGPCKTTKTLTYKRVIKAKSATCVEKKPGQASNTRTAWVDKVTNWWPDAACISAGIVNGKPDTYKCPCNYEALPAFWWHYKRKWERTPITETRESEVTVGGKGIPTPKPGVFTIGYKCNLTRWRLVGSGQHNKNACRCIWFVQMGVPTFDRKYPTTPGTAPAGGGGAVTDSDYPPGFGDPDPSWPKKCTNAACVTTGSVAYTSAWEDGHGTHSENVFKGKWTIKNGYPQPKYEPLEKRFKNSVTVTWKVDTKGASCRTSIRNDQNPGDHQRNNEGNCQGVCEYENVPKGEATSTTTRTVRKVRFIYKKVSKKYSVKIEGVTVSATASYTVPVDYVMEYTAWGDPTIPTFTASQNICKCIALTPGEPAEDPEQQATDDDQKKQDDRDRRAGESTPTPGDGG